MTLHPSESRGLAALCALVGLGNLMLRAEPTWDSLVLAWLALIASVLLLLLARRRATRWRVRSLTPNDPAPAADARMSHDDIRQALRRRAVIVRMAPQAVFVQQQTAYVPDTGAAAPAADPVKTSPRERAAAQSGGRRRRESR